MSPLAKNGLELKKIKSESNEQNGLSFADANSLKAFICRYIHDDSFVIAYLDFEVRIGLFVPSVIKFIFYDGADPAPRFLQKIRIFNEDRELFIWRAETRDFAFRIRQDHPSEGNREGERDVVDVKQAIFGTEASDLADGFIRLTEKRGTQVILPFSNLKVDEKRRRVFLRSRQYLSKNPRTFQAEYFDARMMGFAFVDETGETILPPTHGGPHGQGSL